jgi:hypothetical protein
MAMWRGEREWGERRQAGSKRKETREEEGSERERAPWCFVNSAV